MKIAAFNINNVNKRLPKLLDWLPTGATLDRRIPAELAPEIQVTEIVERRA